MMTEKITFGDVRHLLAEYEFNQVQVEGPYIVYKHEPSGALQAFRAHRRAELVDPMTLASVRKTLVEFGFLKEGEFEEAVREAAVERKANAKGG
jgi:hypothetical protein